MPACDICNAEIERPNGRSLASAEFREAVQKGLNPFASAPQLLLDLGVVFDLSAADLYEQWRTKALVSGTAWLLCQSCSGAVGGSAARVTQGSVLSSKARELRGPARKLRASIAAGTVPDPHLVTTVLAERVFQHLTAGRELKTAQKMKLSDAWTSQPVVSFDLAEGAGKTLTIVLQAAVRDILDQKTRHTARPRSSPPSPASATVSIGAPASVEERSSAVSPSAGQKRPW